MTPFPNNTVQLLLSTDFLIYAITTTLCPKFLDHFIIEKKISQNVGLRKKKKNQAFLFVLLPLISSAFNGEILYSLGLKSNLKETFCFEATPEMPPTFCCHVDLNIQLK